MSGSPRYWVIRCPNCGTWKSAWPKIPRKYKFKCNYCNHSTKLWKQKTQGIGLQHYTVVGGAVAAALVSLKNSEGKKL